MKNSSRRKEKKKEEGGENLLVGIFIESSYLSEKAGSVYLLKRGKEKKKERLWRKKRGGRVRAEIDAVDSAATNCVSPPQTTLIMIR